MKRTGSEMPDPGDASSGDESAPEVIERARLQAEVAQQRVRLAKEELHRARKRLKEAKREAKRARKSASASRKDWKRVRRKAKKTSDVSAAEAPKKKAGQPAQRRRKSGLKLVAARGRQAQSRSSGKRGQRRTRARARK
jgi:hypothetical protein